MKALRDIDNHVFETMSRARNVIERGESFLNDDADFEYYECVEE